MLARVRSAAVLGIDAYLVEVETDIANGLPTFATVGLPQGAVKEGRERVYAAIANSGYTFPLKRITVNLAPADIRKEGSAFDLPIALGVLAATEQISAERLGRVAVLGELGLEGAIRPVRGALPVALAARTAGLAARVLPRDDIAEAGVVAGMRLRGAGTLAESLVARRPFRAPHHTISDAGLIGGGSYPRPGEVSLAHGGVLFLDELPEFRKNVLEVLRQPMEDGVVTIARAAMSLTYPARFMLAAAMNPCPCGYFGDPQHNCVCGPLGVERYLARVSGPLLDRIDIHLEVPAVKYRALADQGGGESSEAVRERVDRARAVQRERFASRPGVYANAHMAPRDIRVFCRVSDGADALLRTAITRLALSARAYHRILKIARTLADLEGAADLQPKHVSEAIQYRSLDRRGLG